MGCCYGNCEMQVIEEGDPVTPTTSSPQGDATRHKSLHSVENAVGTDVLFCTVQIVDSQRREYC